MFSERLDPSLHSCWDSVNICRSFSVQDSYESGEPLRAFSTSEVFLLPQGLECGSSRMKDIWRLSRPCPRGTYSAWLVCGIQTEWICLRRPATLRETIISSNDQLKMLTEANRHITARGVGQGLSVSKLTIHGHLQTLGFVKRLDV